MLNSPHGMSSAPGQPEEARMVLSRSGKRPHLVLPCKGRFKCDSDCLNLKSLGTCSHSVAVAECNNLLTEFLAHFQMTKKTPNFTAVSLHGVPAGSGKKGGAIPRKRRKLKISSNITNHVDHLESSPSSSSALVSGSTTGSASPLTRLCGASTVNILDSQAGPSYTPGSSYSSNWAPPFYDWRYQQYSPPPPMPHAYSVPFSQHDTRLLKLLQCLHLQPYPRVLPPMAGNNSPFKLYFIAGKHFKVCRVWQQVCQASYAAT